MTALHPPVVIRGPRLNLLIAVVFAINAVLRLFDDDPGRFTVAIGAFILVGSLFFGIGYFVNQVVATPDVVHVRSGLMTRSYPSAEAMLAEDVGRLLYVDKTRLKLPFRVSAAMLHEAILRSRGHGPNDLGRQPFGSGRIVDA